MGLPFSRDTVLLYKTNNLFYTMQTDISRAGSIFKGSEKLYTCFTADPDGIWIPDGRLYFADMSFAKQQHAKAALTDTASDGKGKLPIQQHLMEGKSASVITSGQSQLLIEGFGTDTNTHTADLHRTAQGFIPEEKITVEIPVIVVGRTAVMGLSTL